MKRFLKNFGQFGCTLLRTAYNPGSHLKNNKDDYMSQSDYAKIIGSVIFLMKYTHPDIAYVVSKLSRYTHNLDHDHWNALIRLLKCLKGTINWGLHFKTSHTVLEGNYDTNWVFDNAEINSTTSYMFILAGGAISRKSSLEACVAS